MQTHRFFLPISFETLGTLLSDSCSVENLSPLSTPELAALLLIQHADRLQSSEEAEMLYARSLEHANEEILRSSKAVYTEAVARLAQPEAIQMGLSKLDALRIQLLEEEEVIRRKYLRPDGTWDSRFSQHHANSPPGQTYSVRLLDGTVGYLSDEQMRAGLASLDTDIAIEGFAGTGKTTLVQAILSMLESRRVPPEQVLILFQSHAQRTALARRLGRGPKLMTFGVLASALIPSSEDPRRKRHLSHQRTSMESLSVARYAKEHALPAIGSYGPATVARLCRDTVRNFCQSTDPAISNAHLPRDFSGDADAEQELIRLAQLLWVNTLDPLQGLPVHAYHRIKYVALNGWSIRPPISHVLIDESHDLSPAMVQILDRCPQVVISLGDKYQSQRGRPPKRSGMPLRHQLAQSVRAGTAMEELINPIVMAHPLKTEATFAGNRKLPTLVSYYKKALLPEPPAAILVADEWGLFEWMQRLVAIRKEYTLLSSQSYLKGFIGDCIALRARNIPPRHGFLRRFSHWDQVRAHFEYNTAFLNIDRLLERGYAEEEAAVAMTYCVSRETAATGYTLATVPQARNWEFDTVFLTPDVADHCWAEAQYRKASRVSFLYLAMTRTRFALSAPERVRAWIEELSGRAAAIV